MSELPDLEDYFDWDGLEWQDYKSDLAVWFKRCITDFPTGRLDRPYFHGGAKVKLDSDKVKIWFTKWFSQFNEKGDMGRDK